MSIVYQDARCVFVDLCVDFELGCVAITQARYQSSYQPFNVSNLYAVWLLCFGITSVTDF